MRRLRWMSAYLFTAFLGLGLAYTVSVNFLTTARSQSAPSDGSLPPEFMQEVQGSGAAAPAVPPVEAPPKQPPAEAAQPTNPPVSAPPAETYTEGGASPSQIQQTPPMAGTSLGAEDYVYDPAGRRDPFRPYRVIRTAEGVKKTGNEIEPLQRYDLDQLAVMGVLWDVRQPRALVRDGDGNLHTVVKNSKMGRNSGYVATIREGEIVVVETYDDEGRTLKRTRVLEFKK